jgi:hypothetical protein
MIKSSNKLRVGDVILGWGHDHHIAFGISLFTDLSCSLAQKIRTVHAPLFVLTVIESPTQDAQCFWVLAPNQSVGYIWLASDLELEVL